MLSLNSYLVFFRKEIVVIICADVEYVMSDNRDMIEKAPNVTDSSETEDESWVSSEEEDTDHQGDINGNDADQYNAHNYPRQNKLSQYEMVRENNIRERLEKFEETFKEINELKKLMVGENKSGNPREPSFSSKKEKKLVELPSRRSTRISCNRSKNQETEQTKPDLEDCSQEKWIRKLSFKDKTGLFLPNCSGLGFIVRMKNIGPLGYLVSNDLADLAQTQCQLCGLIVEFTLLKDHVTSKHDLLFSLYKKEFGCPETLEKIIHLCGLCRDRIMFHKNSVASHLRSKHREMTMQVEEYFKVYCVDTRGLDQDLGKMTVVQPTVDVQVIAGYDWFWYFSLLEFYSGFTT